MSVIIKIFILPPDILETSFIHTEEENDGKETNNVSLNKKSDFEEIYLEEIIQREKWRDSIMLFNIIGDLSG